MAALLGISPLFASSAGAQPHDRHEHAHERYNTPHWVFDDRYHHNHYYPAIGYSVAVLPPGYVAVGFRSGRYFYRAGVWYQPAGPGFVVVRPPLGIVVPVLPPAYTTVWVSGVPYYYANEIYYAAVQGGYAVAQPPVDPSAAQPQPPPTSPVPPPPGPATQPGSTSAPAPGATWYYCESSKSYYPYVAECKEGWRPVPATPPQAR
jgi:hypothetical protein